MSDTTITPKAYDDDVRWVMNDLGDVWDRDVLAAELARDGDDPADVEAALADCVDVDLVGTLDLRTMPDDLVDTVVGALWSTDGVHLTDRDGRNGLAVSGVVDVWRTKA